MASGGIGLHSAPLVLQLVSFALLLIATLTSPATNVLSLAEQDNYRFGVLGYCHQLDGGWSCSKAATSYDVTLLGNADDWVVGSSARQTLAKILILTPVACFVALVSFVFAVLSHIPAVYSTLFLVVELIVAIVAFLLAALVCVVDFLLFYPHVTYGSWILIPAAIWPLLSAVFIVLVLVFQSSDTNSIDSDEEDNHITIDKVDNFDSDFSAFNNHNDSSLPPPLADEKQYDAFKTTTKSVNDDSYFDNKSSAQDQKPTDFTNNFLPPIPNHNFNSSSYSGLNGRNDSFATANSQPLYDQAGYPHSDGNLGNNKNDNSTTPYPTGDEFNFTPVPISGFGDGRINTDNNGYHNNNAVNNQGAYSDNGGYVDNGYGNPGLASQVSANSHPYAMRRLSNKGPPGSRRVPTGQTSTNMLQSRMPSSVYPETINTHAASNNTGNVPGQGGPSNGTGNHYFAEQDGYYNGANRYDDDSDALDTASDFTSVSQRPPNPLYYQNLQNNNSSNYHSSNYSGQAPPSGNSYQAPPSGSSYQAPISNGGNYRGSPGVIASSPPSSNYNAYNGPIQQPSMGYASQSPPAPRQEGPSKSDILLNSNPEFSLGGAGRPRPGFKRPNGRGPASGGYKRPGANKMITPASLSRDSPYNLR